MPKYTFKSAFATDFEHIPPKNGRPTVLYLHGFCSDCWGRKPETVKAFCLAHGVGLFRFDYAGVGSSMGGWLSLLAAIERPERVRGVIGLAAAPNFVRRFAKLVTPEQEAELREKGRFTFGTDDFTYTITGRFIDTATAECLPEGEKTWPVGCPVHLIQGMKDACLPWHFALDFAAALASENVEVKLLKSSDHRLNDDDAVAELKNSLAKFVNI